MTTKKPEETTFKLSGEELGHALELRHVEEKKVGRVVTMATIIRNALREKYDREIGKVEEKEEVNI